MVPSKLLTQFVIFQLGRTSEVVSNVCTGLWYLLNVSLMLIKIYWVSLKNLAFAPLYEERLHGWLQFIKEITKNKIYILDMKKFIV